MKYLLKKCGSQELGSMTTSNDTPDRGQYLLISKKEEALAFFPPLSEAQLNDFRMIPFTPLYLQGQRVYCRFVYHNDKFHGSAADHPRNEFRIYVNQELQGGNRLFQKDGIVIFRHTSQKDINEGFFIDYVAPTDPNYSACETIRRTHSLGGASINYAIFDGEIPSFEDKVSSLTNAETRSPGIIIAPADMAEVVKSPRTYADLFNLVTFRDFLSVGYNNLCAVTRTSIQYESLCNVEAAHIKPKAHGGTFHPSNGILLSRDMHWAFDHGFFTLNDDYTVRVSKKPGTNLLTPFEKKPILLPTEPSFRPDIESIRWHRRNVFEHFGSIRALEG